MKLNDLLKFNDIVIQCHDNPDADALASGYALYWYLTKKGKSPRFIYRGYNEIKKSNPYLEKCRIICDSDAHYLEHIHLPQYTISVKSKDPKDILSALNTQP